MKKTKWVKHKFSKDELAAQKIWRRATGEHTKLVEALMSCDHYMSRDDMHKRLDRRLDAIDRGKDRAAKMFPDVSESFTMATGTISL